LWAWSGRKSQGRRQKFFQREGESQRKKDQKIPKIELLSIFRRGEKGKRDRKIAKKKTENSTIKPLSTISVPCMKNQGGRGRLLPATDAHARNFLAKLIRFGRKLG